VHEGMSKTAPYMLASLQYNRILSSVSDTKPHQAAQMRMIRMMCGKMVCDGFAKR